MVIYIIKKLEKYIYNFGKINAFLKLYEFFEIQDF